MKKKILILVLALACSLSFGVSAKDKTLAEEYWDNFAETSALEYGHNQGDIAVDLFTSRHGDGSYDFTSGIELNYGLNDNMEFNSYLSGSSWVSPDLDNIDNFYYLQYGGAVKAKLMEQDDWQVSAKAAVDADREDLIVLNKQVNSNLGVYSDKVLRDNLVMHNNLELAFNNSNQSTHLTNGVDYKVDDKQAVKAYLYTTLRDTGMTNALTLLYRNQINDKIKLISAFQKGSSSNVLFSNLIEVQPVESVIISGYYDFNTDYNDNLGIQAQKDFDQFQIKGGYSLSTGEYISSSNLYSNVKYEINDQLDFIGRVNIQSSTGEFSDNTTTTIRTGINYSL